MDIGEELSAAMSAAPQGENNSPQMLSNPLTNTDVYGIINGADNMRSDGGEGSGRYPKGSGDKSVQASETSKSQTGRITTPSKTITQVYDEKTGKRLNVVKGEPATAKFTIAGGNSSRAVKQESRLLSDYGGSKGKWTKKTQDMVVDVDGVKKTAEVHSFYEPTIGHVEQKVKRYRQEG
jgi:hypothetical protein